MPKLRYLALQTILVFFLPYCQAANFPVILEKPVKKGYSQFSGDQQQELKGRALDYPVRVVVKDSAGHAVANFPVVFENLTSPSSKDLLLIEPHISFTDSLGLAVAHIKLGKAKGEYTMLARPGVGWESNFLVYRFTALAKNWVLMMVFGLLGGLGLFLLGMNMMSQGMMKSAGNKMRSILGSLTRNRFIAVGLGTFVTMVIQSSSATTVMLISFVNAGLMKFTQTLGIILGADIGTTITAQLIAFKLTDYALLMIALGFAVQTFTKNEKVRYAGEGILGFGILFFGMHIMSESMYPLRTYEPFIEMIVRLENPFIGIIIGALFTALIQSSSAFVGIMIVLATQGLLSLEASVPLLMGANLGTAITAFLASLKTTREAKKVALAHAVFKLTGVLLLVFWIPDFIKIVKWISPVTETAGDLETVAAELPRQIANAHTVFNVMVTLVTLPFLNAFAKLINLILPELPPKEKKLSTKYLSDDPDIPSSLALNLVKQEVNHMAEIVEEMVEKFVSPYTRKEAPDIAWMKEKEDEVDFLRDSINTYILKITSRSSKTERINEAFEMLYTVKEFEQIADIVSDHYLDKTEEWNASGYEFSDEGLKEMTDYHQQVLKQLKRAVETFKDYNLETAKLMKEKHHKYRQVVIDLQRSHYMRLTGMMEKSISTSKTHLELMTLLVTIYSHATNIARIILQGAEERRAENEG